MSSCKATNAKPLTLAEVERFLAETGWDPDGVETEDDMALWAEYVDTNAAAVL